MAKLIKETPVLAGVDAKRFIAEQSAKKDAVAIQKGKERILKNYNLLRKVSKPATYCKK